MIEDDGLDADELDELDAPTSGGEVLVSNLGCDAASNAEGMADVDDNVQKGIVVYDALKVDELHGGINDGPTEAAKAGVFGELKDVELEEGFIDDRQNVGGPKRLDFVMEAPKLIVPTD